jgi:hypothetical protein
MDLTAIAAGAPQRLAIHRDRPSMSMLVRTLSVGQPRADRPGQGLSIQAGQGPADSGLGRHCPAVRGLSAGAERDPDRLRGISGPLGDRDHRPGAGQHSSGGHGQHGNQWVAAPTVTSRVADGGQVGQQVRGFGVLKRGGVGELSESGWDRG